MDLPGFGATAPLASGGFTLANHRAAVEAVIDELNADPACTGFLVQQPTGLDEFALLSRVDPDKDVDGLHPTNLGWLVLGKPAPLPCTPTGIIELLRRYDVPIKGANVVIVGRGENRQ